MTKSIGIVLIAVAPVLAQPGTLSASRIREHTRFLSNDLLEGRGVGQRGGQLATEYIATQLALAGARPAGNDGTFFQKFTMVGVESAPAARITATAQGKSVDLGWASDFVGVAAIQKPEVRLDGDVIFVGHGISAPEWKWDDFKGVDVKGKVLLLFTNEPPSDNPSFFDGRALTYYGRWTYKYEEGVRRGASAVLIIHTDKTAGYGWDVVRSSWGKETALLKLAPGEPALGFEGWVTRAAGERLLGLAGHGVDELLTAADKPDFKPIDLGLHLRAEIPSKVRELETRNVAGIIPGSDPKLRDEVVIFSAHWDHLGIGTPVNGDAIYNGAIDNATGCAILLELARAWAALGQKPRRSALFLAVSAEEDGLRGSEYYAGHPLVPAAKTAVDLNFDALYPWGRAEDIVINGAEKTSVWAQAQQTARRLTLAVSPDPTPEQGHYFRSDHFSFAKVGIPAFSIDHATRFSGKPADFEAKMFEEYNSKHYHQPSDEFQADWDFTALEQAAQFGYSLGMDLANQDKLPRRITIGSGGGGQ